MSGPARASLSRAGRSTGTARKVFTRHKRVSHAHSENIELQEFIRPNQLEYPSWWTCERAVGWLRMLPEQTAWNCLVCVAVLLAITWVIIDFSNSPGEKDMQVIDLVYNIIYGVHVVALLNDAFIAMQYENVSFLTIFGFLLDFGTYLHYALSVGNQRAFKLICYYLRLHRPFRYLWQLNDYNLKGSILGTTLKYIYIFFVLRITWALIWIHIDRFELSLTVFEERVLHQIHVEQTTLADWRTWFGNSSASQFLNALYIVNKMFIPIGLSVVPSNDIERVSCLLVMLTGCLVVTGAAVASLSLVISLYMRPEEEFRTKYRLIMKIMKESNIPPSLREKVETFYRMYWHKQRAVSATQLLPTYPPTLPAAVYTDIYFEATQKSRILCDLSYQFLSEISKKMSTIYYIPGDTIIKRTSRKSSVIFISYGDIEMLSAEDDVTAVVRMTRGTAVAGCAGLPAAACARAHVGIRAATFCIAHALPAPDLWRVALKYGRNDDQTHILLNAFYEHLEKVKKHYYQKIPEEVKHKSSILHFKRNLMTLKEARDSEGKLLLARADVFLEIAGSYIMRNRADGSQTDDADAICLRSTFPCILQPSSSLQHVWDAFMCCVLVIVSLTHPYFLIFKKSVPMEFRFFDYVITAIFVVDLIVHLSTGNNVEEGVPITFLQTSSQQMRSQWFIMSVAGTLPIFEFVGEGHFAGINKLLRLPKFFRTLKSLEDVCVYQSNVIRFISYTLMKLLACYLVASLQQGFMCFQFGYCVVSNFTHPPYWENNTLDEDTVEHRLSFSLYWAISMITFTTHMESWKNTKWDSALYTLFVLEMCVVFHIFIEAVYSATIMVTSKLREDYDNCIAHVKEFLIRNEVEPLLRQRFITYLQLCWYTDKAYSMTSRKKSSIFHDLPPHVYQDIVTRQRSKYLLSIPFMKLLNKEDLKDVSSKARLFYTSPNEILLNTGDISNEMYLIRQGVCEMVNPETKEVIGTLTVKNYFGVLECLLRLPAFYTVRAVTHVQVFSISKKVLTKVMEMPQIKDAIDFAKEQPEYMRLIAHRESFLWYVPPEPVANTERFRLPRKHEPDSEFLEPFQRLGFFSILRYIFPRFSIRPDGKYIKRYEWFRATCALLSATVFPSYSYMVLQWPWLYFAALLLDCSAFFDIVQRMLVGYYNAEGVLVYHPVSTASHYIKGAFIADVFGWLPLEYLHTSKDFFHEYYRLSSTQQTLMLNRLLQLYRLPGAMHALSGHIDRRDILLVLNAIPLFMALLNTLTCFMIYNSVEIFASTKTDTWMIVPFADAGGSWLSLFNATFRFNMTETPWNLHLATYFWVVYETTTTGYNCFNPSNFSLMEVLFIGMVIGSMITTYFSVRIISIRANVNKELAQFQEDMRDILAFMRRENLDRHLQKQVRDHFEYNWNKMGGMDHALVLKLCDQITLRTDVTLHLYGSTFAQCPFLSRCDISLLRIVGRAVRNMYFLHGMILVEKDDVMENMFFVDYGSVICRITDDERMLSTVVKLHKGSVFGNLNNVVTVRSTACFVAASDAHLLQVNAVAFHQYIIADFPQIGQMMQTHRPNNESYIVGINDGTQKDGTRSSTDATRKDIIRYLYHKDELVQSYLIVVSLVCVYADLYNAGFQDNSMLLIVIVYGLDVGFYLKILFQYLLPHLADSNHMKKQLLMTQKAYFAKDFKYDLVSCLPLELLSLACGKYQWMVFSLLRLNRMLRIVTVYECLRKHSSRITVNLTLSTIFSVFIWFTLFVHAVTCLWYFISLIEDQYKPGTSWKYKGVACDILLNIVAIDKGGSWCNSEYICSMYFVLTTFTQNGVGDIMPKNQAEVLFVALLQIISTLVYMIYVGEFSNIIQYQSFRCFSFYSRYLELQEFLKNNRVSKNLVSIVNRYSLHLWRNSRGLQVPHFLTTAPQCVRLRIMAAAYLPHISKNPVFEDCEPAFLRQLVGCLRLYTYNEGMYVVKEGEITDSMYFIHSGSVMETSVRGGNSRTYHSTECFGLENGLIYDTPFVNSYRTLGKCQVLTLRLIDWEYLLEHFPESTEIIYKSIKRDDDYPHQPHPRVKMQSMESRWSDVLSPSPGRPKPPPPSNHPSKHERSSREGHRHHHHHRSKESRSSVQPTSPLLPSTPPVVSKLDDESAIKLKSSLTPGLLPMLSKPESTMNDKPATPTTFSTFESHEPDKTQSQDGGVIKALLDKIKPYLSSVLPSTVLEEAKTPLRSSDIQLVPTSSSKEPIVTQPYSAHSLKIFELPPSSSKLKQSPATSTLELNSVPGQELQSRLYNASAARLSIEGSPAVEDPTTIEQPQPLLKLPELVDITEQSEFMDAENVSDNYASMWPMDSRKSTAQEILPDENQEEPIEISRIKSLRSVQSLGSLQENERGPRDVDEALKLKSPTTLIGKMESKAKKLFRNKQDSEMSLQSDESSDKDILLLEEDEAATSALLHKLKKNDRVVRLPTDLDEIVDTFADDSPPVEESQSSNAESIKLKRLKLSPVQIHEPTLDEIEPVASNESPTETPRLFVASEEEPTSTARLKRTVHYKISHNQLKKSHSQLTIKSEVENQASVQNTKSTSSSQNKQSRGNDNKDIHQLRSSQSKHDDDDTQIEDERPSQEELAENNKASNQTTSKNKDEETK